MRPVLFTPLAQADLLDIWIWLARAAGDSLADGIIDRIEQKVSVLARHPEIGPARPDIAAEARMLVAERWLVLYRILDDTVEVVRIVDGARDLRAVAWPSKVQRGGT